MQNLMKFLDVELVSCPMKQAWERCRNTFKCQLSDHTEFIACLLPRLLVQFCDVVMLFISSICEETVCIFGDCLVCAVLVVSLDACQ